MRVYRHNSERNEAKWVSEKWYTDVRLSHRRYRLPLFENERVSRDFAAKLEAMIGQYEAGQSYDKSIQLWLGQLSADMLARLIKMGLVDAGRAEGGRPLTDHLEDYIDFLRHKGNVKPYCDLCNSRIQRIITGCKFRTLADVSASKIQKYVSDELSSGRISQNTSNHYLRQWKGFAGWLYREDRIQSDMTKHLTMRTVTEIKKDRRALTVDEIAYLLKWVSDQGPKTRSLTGWERSLLYRLALTTGLRRNEIKHLQASSIDFRTKTVHVPSAYTKNRREAVLPLRDDVLEDLRTLTANKLPEAPLFAHVTDKTSKLLHKDMADARKNYLKDGGKDKDFLNPDTADGEIDFHSLRHSFGSMLASSGVHPKTAQTLMRHSTITLTMDRYSHSYRGADVAAVEGLPSFESTKKKTVKKA